jgi:aspartyl-tRNA(Asn)/glutamyl-tRNA(Gln) amidotransferase subunit B
MEFEPVIGLEVHSQLKTKTKIFCKCSTSFGAPPNTHTCPVCLGMPGVLPVLNKKVVQYAICLALATNCKISKRNRFARKNYFYPDLPKGYQISQYELPIAEFGHIDIEVDDREKRIGITRIHMEEDAGKLNHDPLRPLSLVDFNRTGVPLLEIVSEPDIRSSEEAGAYLRKLRSIVRYLNICDGNMEEGSFRCDANISIRPSGQKEFGTRAELKNLNSFRHVEQAIKYEINRQKMILEEGGEVVQETRLWDPEQGKSNSMRSKEEAHDYRYFPDPDLVPLEIDSAWIHEIKNTLPELPDAKRQRFINQYKLSHTDADLLTSSRELAEYFELCLKELNLPKQIANWIMGPLLGMLNAQGKDIEQSPVLAKDLAGLVKLIEDGVISGKIAKTVFEEVAQTGKPPEKIVEDKGLVQVTDVSAIDEVISKILSNSPKEVEAYKNGKTKLMGFFVGQVMKETKGKANPKIVNQVLKEKLGG